MAAVPTLGRATNVEAGVSSEAELTRALYEQYAGQIFRYCLHQLGSREEAEDAVQSTFLNAFRGIKRGIVPELESAWLFKIAHNVCLSRRRSTWRRGRIEAPTDFDIVEELAPAPARPEDELIGLQDVLEQMPEQQRRAILLREWQGLSYREIAEELELSQAAVETLIFRARRSLAQGLEQPHVAQRKRRQRLGAGIFGNLLSSAQSLFLGGGAAAAKVAATVAVVSAGTVVATAPVQHQPRQHQPKPHAKRHTKPAAPPPAHSSTTAAIAPAPRPAPQAPRHAHRKAVPAPVRAVGPAPTPVLVETTPAAVAPTTVETPPAAPVSTPAPQPVTPVEPSQTTPAATQAAPWEHGRGTGHDLPAESGPATTVTTQDTPSWRGRHDRRYGQELPVVTTPVPADQWHGSSTSPPGLVGHRRREAPVLAPVETPPATTPAADPAAAPPVPGTAAVTTPAGGLPGHEWPGHEWPGHELSSHEWPGHEWPGHEGPVVTPQPPVDTVTTPVSSPDPAVTVPSGTQPPDSGHGH